MKINWFTLIAQIINFLILVWLLKKFLYKPILNAVNDREQKIIDKIKNAEARETIAQQEKESFQQKNEAFDNDKKELMAQAVADVTGKKKELLDNAKATVKTFQINLEKTTRENQENTSAEVQDNNQKQVFDMARKALSDLASASLEKEMVSTLLTRIEKLSKEEKEDFKNAFTKSKDDLLVKSAFELSVSQQYELKNALAAVTGITKMIKFETATEIISGIELSTTGYKFSWSFSEYLTALQKNIVATKRRELPFEGKKEIYENT